MKSSSKSSLVEESKIIFPILQRYYLLYCEKQLASHDLVGIFILLYLSLRRKNKWSNGLLPASILRPEDVTYDSISVHDIPEVLELLNQKFLLKKLGSLSKSDQTNSVTCSQIRVLDIFNRLNLIGLKNNSDLHVNRCLVFWSLGKRPVVLLHYIPSPMEVLSQQARGERVMTMFLKEEELAKCHVSTLTYMNGNVEHERDPLEFLTHDLKHMENFIDPVTHYEQKGFFRAMLSINERKIKCFFLKQLGYHEDLWYELEYVISDM
jgi:hypothetical protein